MKLYKRNSVLTMLFAATFALASCVDNTEEENVEDLETTETEAVAFEDNTKWSETEAADLAAKEDAAKMEARNTSITAKTVENNELETLESALIATNLDSILSEPGNYTVFAPTENAFSKLPEGTLENLMKEENKDQLASILKYHVVSGVITSDKLANAIKGGNGKYTFATITGESLTASMKGDQVVIEDATGNKAHIVQGNLQASNGIIYVIDNVLMAKK